MKSRRIQPSFHQRPGKRVSNRPTGLMFKFAIICICVIPCITLFNMIVLSNHEITDISRTEIESMPTPIDRSKIDLSMDVGEDVNFNGVDDDIVQLEMLSKKEEELEKKLTRIRKKKESKLYNRSKLLESALEKLQIKVMKGDKSLRIKVDKVKVDKVKVDDVEVDNDKSDSSNKNDPYLTMFGAERVQESLSNLPKWLQEYVAWHREQTTGPNKDSIKYLVVTCLDIDICGGLSDRLRVLPFYLLMGSMSNRVLCIHWSKPFGLEAFFKTPNGGIQWQCPSDLVDKLDLSKDSFDQNLPYKQLGWVKKDPSFVNTTETILHEIKRIDHERFILTRICNTASSRINSLNKIFQAHSYKDKMPSIGGWSHIELMGDIFRVMFEPVEEIARRVNTTMTKLGLEENKYTTVHIRARYPTVQVASMVGGAKDAEQHDKNGGAVKYEGTYKTHIGLIMKNAFECGRQLSQRNKAEVIVMSTDSNDVADDVFSNGIELKDGSSLKPIVLQHTGEVLHLEGTKKKKKHEEYYSIIEDLLVMSGSKCIAHDNGSFGAFAAAIGGRNRCRTEHRIWTGQTESCPNGRGDRTGVNILESDLLFNQIPGGEGKVEYGKDLKVNEDY
uniref:Uncharacterized protein n=1 Tax=Chaetoceros debilis TaxID=122233 RepID=A0A7S3PZC1_9STRA|mmetsp:Transcript_12756/g.18560  ORF Transcript_12756/g.18560 Transcript_12756/m.18560 type:complete len:615 (+) Transcript_12756:158-2002(+)